MILSFLGVILFIGLIVFMFIRDQGMHERGHDVFYHPHEGGIPPDVHHTSLGQHGVESHATGERGGRDMSHDPHDFGQSSDSGGGWGGDAGGGDAGGGGPG
jgi:hypothetical protein